MITAEENIIAVNTPNTTMLIRENGDFAELLYYGETVRDLTGCEVWSRMNRLNAHSSVDNYSTYNTLCSFFGDGNDKETFVYLIHGDGSFTSKFVYAGHEILSCLPQTVLPQAHGVEQAVVLHYEDRIHRVRLNIYISVYGHSDVLTFSSEVINDGKQKIRVRRLYSAQIDTDGVERQVLTLDGAWGSERHKHLTNLQCGTYLVDSKVGSSSAKHNPFVAVQDNHSGYWTAFNPIWSGNHRFCVDISPLGQTRLLSGMNDFMLDYPVEGGECFSAPQTAVVFAPDLNRITSRMHAFVNEHIIPNRFYRQERPILLNNWEATYMDFNRNKLEELVNCASELGIELFVLDDGWFGARTDDRSGLGDWYDNEAKTGGLKGFAEFVRGKGMKFGLWVEPEMISRDSDLYRAHPEFAMQLPEGQPIERRWQRMLDLCNPVVVDYLVEALSKVFDECRPDYIKWDCNRVMSDVYSALCKDIGRYFYDYTVGLYTLLRRLTKRYPEILFESCSSGGNRFDLGMLTFMPQTWCSDDTDARERVAIQCGTLMAYPQNTMGAHVSASPNHQTHHSTPLKERFIVASAGVFGYELDLTRLSSADLNEIKRQVAFYKAHKNLLQFGKYECFRDDADFYCYAFFSEDRTEVIVTVIRKQILVNRIAKKVKIGGFCENLVYNLSVFGDSMQFCASGEVLNREGLDIADIMQNNDFNAISACMIYCKAK